MVATWKDSSDEDTDDNVERALMAIRESEDEPDEESKISPILAEAAPEEEKDDGIGLSTQGNLTGETEQRGTNPQITWKPVHEHIPQQQNQEGTSKEIDTHIAISTKLDMDEPGSSVDQKMYSEMIGSLLYLTASRPNIVFSLGLCYRFQENSKESHLTAVKRILR
nr:uncharacterized protein LOC117275157 [Nicotiana tomentosiformis]